MGDGRGWPQRSPWALAVPCPVLERTWRRAMLGGRKGFGLGRIPGAPTPSRRGQAVARDGSPGVCSCGDVSLGLCPRASSPTSPSSRFQKITEATHTRETRTQARGNERQTPRPRPPQRRCPGAAAGKDRQRRRLLPGNAAREHAHTWGPLFKSKR